VAQPLVEHGVGDGPRTLDIVEDLHAPGESTTSPLHPFHSIGTSEQLLQECF
jgi:hypothetical protein